MTDNTAECELTQRKVVKEETDTSKEEEVKEEESKKVTDETESKEESKEVVKPKTRQDFDANWKYQWYLFRYYHFKVADTIDLYLSAACLWIINLYMRLFMGIGPEPSSALSED